MLERNAFEYIIVNLCQLCICWIILKSRIIMHGTENIRVHVSVCDSSFNILNHVTDFHET
jgi:hypothetical protein